MKQMQIIELVICICFINCVNLLFIVLFLFLVQFENFRWMNLLRYVFLRLNVWSNYSVVASGVKFVGYSCFYWGVIVLSSLVMICGNICSTCFSGVSNFYQCVDSYPFVTSRIKDFPPNFSQSFSSLISSWMHLPQCRSVPILLKAKYFFELYWAHFPVVSSCTGNGNGKVINSSILKYVGNLK